MQDFKSYNTKRRISAIRTNNTGIHQQIWTVYHLCVCVFVLILYSLAFTFDHFLGQFSSLLVILFDTIHYYI